MGLDDARERSGIADGAVPAAPARGLPVAVGNVPRVLRETLAAIHARHPATLAIVLETEGSTYAGAGALALFSADGHVGWLSGGCLEPDIQRAAMDAATLGRIGWIQIDTRGDDALFSGAATGCRGRLRIALLPLHAMAGVADLFAAWLRGHQDLRLTVGSDGAISMATPSVRRHWRLQADVPAWAPPDGGWSHTIPRPPEVLVLGNGPEVPTLAPLLCDLGWHVGLAERRPRWRDGLPAGVVTPEDGTLAGLLALLPRPDAALVMHHAFEPDRDALETLALRDIPFIGLLGPARRGEDLLKVMPAGHGALLRPRLRTPVGTGPGGRGPEAIALGIAAQLQAWRHAGGG